MKKDRHLELLSAQGQHVFHSYYKHNDIKTIYKLMKLINPIAPKATMVALNRKRINETSV